MKALKIGIIAVVAIIAVTLITLRITGLEPQYLDLNQLRAHHMIARPGLWLKGQLVTVPVTDWSFVNDVKDPGRSLNTILVETRTPYLIPHSVRVVPHVRNGQLFIQSHQDRMDRKFPYDKAWTADVARDPRVRIKIGGNCTARLSSWSRIAPRRSGFWAETRKRIRKLPTGPSTSLDMTTSSAFSSGIFPNMPAINPCRVPRALSPRPVPERKPSQTQLYRFSASWRAVDL